MTMPHLMNCAHMANGHCLDCVKAAWEEAEADRAALQRIVDFVKIHDFANEYELRQLIAGPWPR